MFTHLKSSNNYYKTCNRNVFCDLVGKRFAHNNIYMPRHLFMAHLITFETV